MSLVKLVLRGLVVLIATVAVGVLMSASASAHRFVDCLKAASGSKGAYEESKCEKVKTGGEWEKFEVTGEVTGTGGVAKMTTTLLKAEIAITCKKAHFAGVLEKEGASAGEADFEECEAGNKTEPFRNCEVPNIKFKLKGLLFDSPAEIEFKPETGSTFVDIVLKNKAEKNCVEKGTFPIEGTQTCSFTNAATFAIEHEIKCEPAGSHLTFGHETASFEQTRAIETVTGDDWAAE